MINAGKLFRELVGLFIDDGALASSILGIVLLSSILVMLIPDDGIAAGVVLLLGCLGVLFANVMKAAHR
jgi:hypothetical protein